MSPPAQKNSGAKFAKRRSGTYQPGGSGARLTAEEPLRSGSAAHRDTQAHPGEREVGEKSSLERGKERRERRRRQGGKGRKGRLARAGPARPARRSVAAQPFAAASPPPPNPLPPPRSLPLPAQAGLGSRTEAAGLAGVALVFTRRGRGSRWVWRGGGAGWDAARADSAGKWVDVSSLPFALPPPLLCFVLWCLNLVLNKYPPLSFPA